MPNRPRTLPQPPLVWGPSEVNEWIQGTHPSGARPKRGDRKHAGRIAGLSAKVGANSVNAVRERIAGTVRGLGFAVEMTRKSGLLAVKGDRRIRARLRRSIVSDSTFIGLHFEPPVQPATAKKILEALSDAFPIAQVTFREV